MAKQDHRALPPLDVDDLQGFQVDVKLYRAGPEPEEVAGRLVEPLNQPPWILVKRFGGRTEAGLVAVAMLAPSEGEQEEPWLVRGVLSFEDGPPVLSRFAVEHLNEPREVTGFVLKRLRLAELRNRAAGVIRLLGYVPLPSEEKPPAARPTDTLATKRGRKGHPPEFYARIAFRCIELSDSGRRDVLKVLADEEDAKYQTVRGWTMRCRDLGLLAKPRQRGVAGFTPGPNLHHYRQEGTDG